MAAKNIDVSNASLYQQLSFSSCNTSSIFPTNRQNRNSPSPVPDAHAPNICVDAPQLPDSNLSRIL